MALLRSLAPWAKATYAAVMIWSHTNVRSTAWYPSPSISRRRRSCHRTRLASTPIAVATSRLWNGRQMPTLSHPLAGSQSLCRTFLSALNCSASPSTRKVGKASSGARRLAAPAGSSASRIVCRTMTNVVHARTAPSSGEATQDMVIVPTTSQSTTLALTHRPMPRMPPRCCGSSTPAGRSGSRW